MICKKNRLLAVMIAGAMMIIGGCGTENKDVLEESTLSNPAAITIGFAQVGEESDWRRANSKSICDTFSAENGYNLIYVDSENDPEKQMSAVRKFIQEGVDYIVLEPIVEDGWDNILSEVKEAGIPLIIADRSVSVSDDSLYSAWVGSDALLEGERACEWLNAYAESENIDPEDIRIVNIMGTEGSSVQIGRDNALHNAVKKYGWSFLGAEPGEFTQAKGKEAMEQLLKKYSELNVVYCDNDNEAYGAIDILQNEGKKIGSDIEAGEIMIISFDASNGGLECVKNGQISCNCEDNPLLGPKIEEILKKLEAGETVEKKQYVDEQIFAIKSDVTSVTVRGKEYPVVNVTDELLKKRVY